MARIGEQSLTGREVLVVRAGADVRDDLARSLRAAGARVSLADTGEDAIALVALGVIEVVIADADLRDMTSRQLIRRVRRASPGTQTVVLAGRATRDDPAWRDASEAEARVLRTDSGVEVLDAVRATLPVAALPS
jgi:DNA-binding NtrC family response regulator